jgi:hypothetical protein
MTVTAACNSEQLDGPTLGNAMQGPLPGAAAGYTSCRRHTRSVDQQLVERFVQSQLQRVPLLLKLHT